MQLLYCDETNLEERAGDFLIYGGLVVDGAQAGALSAAIDEIRTRRGVPRDYQLKFNPGPPGMSHQDFIALKQEVLDTAYVHGVRMLVYVVLHDIASGPDAARRNGINTVCFHFHCLLNRLGSAGLVLIDRFNDAGNVIDAHLREKFTVGLTGLPYAKEMRLPTIIGFHYSAIGQSHMPSLVDVALGTLRFAVNAHTRQQHQHMSSAEAMIALLARLLWREDGATEVPEIGFIFSPKVVRSTRYRECYQSLKDFLAAQGLVTAQPITGDRQY